jgi:putative PIN family toxin of toxin-antitoxin system
MTNIVIDTNILVSAALSPNGKPAQIATLISKTSDAQVFYSAAIMDEYRRVLSYGRLNIAAETRNGILRPIELFGVLIEPHISTVPMPDETDRIFYDAAKGSGAILITGNTKHYPVEDLIMTPSRFLELYSAESRQQY